VIYNEYDFVGGDVTLDRKSLATSREFPRRRARFRREAAAEGDYQYDDADDDDVMTSLSASGATSGVNNSISDASSHRQMSLPTDPEVRLVYVMIVGLRKLIISDTISQIIIMFE